MSQYDAIYKLCIISYVGNLISCKPHATQRNIIPADQTKTDIPQNYDSMESKLLSTVISTITELTSNSLACAFRFDITATFS